MFSKSANKSKTEPRAAPKPISSGAAEPSRISGDMKIVGDVLGAGDLEIDGWVEGDIESRSLRVGESGKIKGNISAESVRILGSVTGRVEAKTIAVAASAKVKGDLIHGTVSIEAGAEIEGHLRRAEGDTTKSGDRERTAESGDASNVAKIGAASGPYGGPGKAALD